MQEYLQKGNHNEAGKLETEAKVTFSIKLDSLFTSCVSFRRLASAVSCPAGEWPGEWRQKEWKDIYKSF